jgi:hypothetical protein
LDALKLSVRHKSRDFAMLLDQALLESVQGEPLADQQGAGRGPEELSQGANSI